MKSKETKPISPNEIMDNLKTIIPEAVIQAVNELLKEGYRGSYVSFKQKDLISRIIKIDPSIEREDLFKKKYLDFESIFEKQGWKVEYNSPCRDESYDEYFKFTPKNKNKPKHPFF